MSSVLQNIKKATYDLGYKFTLTRNKVNAVLDKAEVFADATIKIDHKHCYVPNCTTSIQQQGNLFK